MERERHEPSASEALAELEQIEAQIRVMGSVDTEPYDLHAIKQKLLKKEISPEEAINQARAIYSGRQDYH